MKIEITKHPVRSGYMVTFPNGRIWSIVDLSSPPRELGESADHMVHSIFKNIGELYDRMGGRFEGMPTPEFDNQVRAHSLRAAILRACGEEITDDVLLKEAEEIVDAALAV